MMRSIRLRTWAVVAAGAVAVGCHREPPSPPATASAAEPAPEVVAPPVTPAPVAPVPVAVQPPAPQPPAPPPVFPFPADTAGKELPKVVAPRAPAPLPVERFGTAPKERTPPAAVVGADSLGKMTYPPPPALPKRPTGFTLHAPAERVPFDLGVGAADVPARPSFVVEKVEPVRAPDVTQPPPLASLAKQVPDRASLEDPAAEPAGAVIVNRVVSPAFERAEFWRMVLPDPFELAAQVKPVVPPGADLGLAPVTVSPMRPR